MGKLSKTFPQRDGFNSELHQTFHEKLILILQVFQKAEEEKNLPNSFYVASIFQKPRPKKKKP